ncbi:transposase family protein, partial [Escherichia coli]|uniref:transposase family protein n=1 Tax=Escherichia coli TaxID=562 RepID=UPI0012C29001
RGWVDRGYEGIERVANGWEIEKPKKKAKGRELTEGEKGRNREINGVRVEVEHKILSMKRYQVFGGRYRGRMKGYEETVEILAGLVNMEQMRRMGMDWKM